MPETYIIGIDQSTQGTKALLFDREARLVGRYDLPHEQKVNELGWVSHDPEKIYRNTVRAVSGVLEQSGIDRRKVAGIGISNQRETALIWEKRTGKPLADAVVWQCARADAVCRRKEIAEQAGRILDVTGLKLSPYFPAAKYAWLLEHTEGARKMAKKHALCFGTIDTWLLYKMTGGKAYKTDYSNASRTQLFDIFARKWDEELCRLFGLDPADLPEVCDSNSLFGETDLDGVLERPVPVHSMLGDSHAALYGQGCLKKGNIKATYGTGSSIMMNIGEEPVRSSHGVVTSLAWGMDGTVQYVLEGNINYTGAVISWMKDQMGLIDSPGETEGLCFAAGKDDHLYFVPAFTGLGAPYWKSQAEGVLCGITRTTKKAEIVRAGVECIAYQIADVIRAMEQDAGLVVEELRTDGGPTKNKYLMQFQSDVLGAKLLVPEVEELSGRGAACACGIALGVYQEAHLRGLMQTEYLPQKDAVWREKKHTGWKQAVQKTE